MSGFRPHGSRWGCKVARFKVHLNIAQVRLASIVNVDFRDLHRYYSKYLGGNSLFICPPLAVNLRFLNFDKCSNIAQFQTDPLPLFSMQKNLMGH